MEQLALEYLRGAERLKERIAALQRERTTARGEHYFGLERRIDLLRDEYYHMRSVARHLLRSQTGR